MLLHPEYIVPALVFTIIGLHVLGYNQRKTLKVLTFAVVMLAIAGYLLHKTAAA